jgi:hypothetical protein
MAKRSPKKSAKKSDEFTLRVHATGAFGKTHQESGQRSAGAEAHRPGVRDLEGDELRIHDRAFKTRGRGPTELPRREREAED